MHSARFAGRPRRHRDVSDGERRHSFTVRLRRHFHPD
jgi:hypothetical protein